MAEPIHCLVFSKDRAMQLDAFLRSAERYTPYASVTVCVASDTPAYDLCRLRWGREHTFASAKAADPTHEWIRGCARWWYEMESFTLEHQVKYFCSEHERIVFHTDDEVFYRPIPAALLDNDEDVITLRQGRNTTYCQVLDQEQAIPATFPRWKWRDAELDFAYPLSLNATIYRAEWIRPLLNFHFENPTQLEAGLACQHMNFGPEWMVAPELSCTVAMPHNAVSVSSGCPRGGNPEWQPYALCEKYLEGWRIDLDAMDFSGVNAAHVEVPLKFYQARTGMHPNMGTSSLDPC